MFGFNKAKTTTIDFEQDENADFIQSMNEFCATISFTPDGNVIHANDLFLNAVGYSLSEIEGKHHRMFCEPSEVSSIEYASFWKKLAEGQSHKGQFQRRKKDGSVLWLEATYFPIKHNGQVVKVFKIANDITEEKIRTQAQDALLNAIDRSNATIEFEPDGTVITANSNFVQTLGYNSVRDIEGKHHRLFCYDEFYQEHPNFWQELAAGDVKSGLFLRKDRDGNQVWIEATYNPVYNTDGEVVRIVKVAANVTERMECQRSVQHAAGLAHDSTEKTAQDSAKGAELLRRSVDSSSVILDQVTKSETLVEELNTQSEEISKIITTISAIAEQTNLLALNAAIEAARAGENGRGFAVVADEVRSLAARTSTSTGEITGMVTKNTELVSQVRGSMLKVTDQVKKNEELINEASGIINQILEGANEAYQSIGDLVAQAESH